MSAKPSQLENWGFEKVEDVPVSRRLLYLLCLTVPVIVLLIALWPF